MGFPGKSACKESACNAGDPSSFPELGRSPGAGIGCPLQYSWASLVAQMAKNPPAMRETWVRSLGWEDPLEEDTATHSSILARRSHVDRGAWRATVRGVQHGPGSWTLWRLEAAASFTIDEREETSHSKTKLTPRAFLNCNNLL